MFYIWFFFYCEDNDCRLWDLASSSPLFFYSSARWLYSSIIPPSNIRKLLYRGKVRPGAKPTGTNVLRYISVSRFTNLIMIDILCIIASCRSLQILIARSIRKINFILLLSRVKKWVSSRVKHIIRSETLGETLWREKSRQQSSQKSHWESWRESRQDSRRDFFCFFFLLVQRVSPRVSDRIICMILGETLSETRFFTRVVSIIKRRSWLDCTLCVCAFDGRSLVGVWLSVASKREERQGRARNGDGWKKLKTRKIRGRVSLLSSLVVATSRNSNSQEDSFTEFLVCLWYTSSWRDEPRECRYVGPPAIRERMRQRILATSVEILVSRSITYRFQFLVLLSIYHTTYHEIFQRTNIPHDRYNSVKNVTILPDIIVNLLRRFPFPL